MSGIVPSLLEMGFPKERIDLAIAKTRSQDLQLVMDWMLSHEEELDANPSVFSELFAPEREIAVTIPSAPIEPPAARARALTGIPAPIGAPASARGAPSATISVAPPDTLDDIESLSTAETPALIEALALAEPEPDSEGFDIQPATAVALSVICDDCNKVFKNTAEVEYHAAKSGHENFSESTEGKKPLTEEEKKEQLALIEAKLKQRRLEREAREKEEALEKERMRIKTGKEILEAKKKHEELEMKKIIQQRKKEKEDERSARVRVKEQIEADKLARKAKYGEGNQAPATESAIVEPKDPDPAIEKKPQNYSEVKLQIRLTDGKTLVQNFGIKEPLSAVRLFVEMNHFDGPFNLMTSFPRKVFTDDDYDKPLEALGLAPTATLIVTKI